MSCSDESHDHQNLVWAPFDPSSLVELARAQYRDEPALATALARIHYAARGCSAYDYTSETLPPDGPLHRFEWFEVNMELIDGDGHLIVLDLLRDGRVGGIERVNDI
jgi:hypothetical protein